MKSLWRHLATRLAIALIAAASCAMPRHMWARYYLEWRAELEEYERQGLGQVIPAIRIIVRTPATRHALWLPRHPLWVAGNKLFAMNDKEAYWWHWQVTRLYGGMGRQYRDSRFEPCSRTGRRSNISI
jgi:hypothetical protein